MGTFCKRNGDGYINTIKSTMSVEKKLIIKYPLHGSFTRRPCRSIFTIANQRFLDSLAVYNACVLSRVKRYSASWRLMKQLLF